MSKIQFNQLNTNSSDLEVLNEKESSHVVGGFYRFRISMSFSSDNDFVSLIQLNENATQQTALGGFGGDTVNTNTTNQSNSAFIVQ